MSIRPGRPGRVLSAVLAAVLAGAAGVALAPSAAAAPTAAQSHEGAAWLVTQLVGGDYVEGVAPNGNVVPSPLLTADVLMALTAAEATGADASVALAGDSVSEWLRASAAGLLGAPPRARVAAYAKLLLTLVARGEPTTFSDDNLDDYDLAARLASLECGSASAPACSPDIDDAVERGRFADTFGVGTDNSNVISQALAILALERATSEGASDEAVRFLMGSQCDDGGFSPGFTNAGIDYLSTRRRPAAAVCVSDPQTTSVVIQTLVEIGETCSAVEAATWLQAEAVSGSWTVDVLGVATPTSVATAAASQALTSVGADTAAARAFLTTLQDGTGGFTLLAGSPVDVAATAAAVQALAEVSLLTLGTGAAPSTELRCGSAEPVDPEPVDPEPVDPEPVDPEPVDPEPTDPGPTRPEPTDPGPTRPEPTETVAPRPVPVTMTPVTMTPVDLTNGGTELAATGTTSWPAVTIGGLLVLLGAGVLHGTRSRV